MARRPLLKKRYGRSMKSKKRLKSKSSRRRTKRTKSKSRAKRSLNQKVVTKIHDLKPLNHLRVFHHNCPGNISNDEEDYMLYVLKVFSMLRKIKHEELDTEVEDIQVMSGDIVDDVLLQTQTDLRNRIHERSSHHIFLRGLGIDF